MCYITCYIAYVTKNWVFSYITQYITSKWLYNLVCNICCWWPNYVLCNMLCNMLHRYNAENILYMTTLLLYTYIDNPYIKCSIICYIRNDIKVHSWLCITTTWLFSSWGHLHNMLYNTLHYNYNLYSILIFQYNQEHNQKKL